MTVRVGLNALFLRYPYSGTGRYLRALIQYASDDVQYRLLGSRAYPAPDPNDPAVRLDIARSPLDRKAPALAKVWFEQIAFPLWAIRAHYDVAHVPYFAPPMVSSRPTVVTVHDLVPIVHPSYRKRAAYRLYVALVLAGLRQSRLVVTDSEASATELTAVAGVSRSKVRVVPLGVGERFHPVRDDQEQRKADSLRRSCGIDGPYILCVTGFDRRKNVDRLIAAYAQVRSRGVTPRLVIVGAIRDDQEFFYDPRPDLERLGLRQSVILLGARRDEEVWALLTGATGFVFPSRYEGFGLPPLEAMACGAPVACSGASSLPEVVGDAGLIFDAEDTGSIAHAIQRLISDSALCADLSARGIARASSFTWPNTAQRTARIYVEANEGKA